MLEACKFILNLPNPTINNLIVTKKLLNTEYYIFMNFQMSLRNSVLLYFGIMEESSQNSQSIVIVPRRWPQLK